MKWVSWDRPVGTSWHQGPPELHAPLADFLHEKVHTFVLFILFVLCLGCLLKFEIASARAFDWNAISDSRCVGMDGTSFSGMTSWHQPVPSCPDYHISFMSVFICACLGGLPGLLYSPVPTAWSQSSQFQAGPGASRIARFRWYPNIS